MEASERQRERERALSTLRPGCIYYTLIVEEEVLWRGVLSLRRVEGLRDRRRIFIYQALSENTEATALKIRDVVWEELDENGGNQEACQGVRTESLIKAGRRSWVRPQRRGVDALALSGGEGRQAQDQSTAPPSRALAPVLGRGCAPLESRSE